MPARKLSLSSKIFGVLGVFFLVALVAIGLTLHVSWRLEGVAAAINDMGSQRMRTQRIAYLLAASVDQHYPTPLNQEIDAEIERLGNVQRALEVGDSSRPMFLPEQLGIRSAAIAMHNRWREQVRPLVMEFISIPEAERRHAIAREYAARAESFVADINRLIGLMEQNYADSTNLLRSYQIMLVVLAITGTIVLLGYSFVLIVRPMRELQNGMQRMTADEFSVRLEVSSNDEFGELAEGFNRMAGHLQNLYQTLEDRVESKTRSLGEKNQELATLYEITAFLNEPMSTEELCNGFLHRTIRAIAADGGTLRLYSEQDKGLYLLSHKGLSNEFATREAALNCGECLCGEAVQESVSLTSDISTIPPAQLRLQNCRLEGIQTVAAFPIIYDKQVIGVYTLMFRSPRHLTAPERHLLETLGQNLAVALENQRLQSSAKELAVSAERNMMAQELHDSIAQSLAFLNIQTQLMDQSLAQGKTGEAQETLARIREGVQESYDDVRELLVHFRTRIEHAGLENTIAKALKKLEVQTGISTSIVISGHGMSLPHDTESQIFHIVQEALSNVRKHSGAKNVRIHLSRSPDNLTITVEDNGRGFATDKLQTGIEEHEHVGLMIMQERAQRIGGTCEISAAPGAGTSIKLLLPRTPAQAT